MSLFSWFTNSTKINSPKNSKAILEQELVTFNNNTMWPVAKVRTNTTIQQQVYISSVSHFKEEIKVTALKEHTNEI